MDTNEVREFLKQEHRLFLMREEIRTQSRIVASLASSVKSNMEGVGSKCMELDPDVCSMFNINNIRCVQSQRREYLGKGKLHDLLSTALSAVEPKIDRLDEVVSGAVEFIWSNRAVISTSQLSVGRDRKRQRSGED